MNEQQINKMTEKQLQNAVVKLATYQGWQHYHTWNSFRSVAGFPDLVLAHNDQRRLIFAELKTEKGKMTNAQTGWLHLLGAVTDGLPQGRVGVHLWRPSDWADGTVEKVLKGDG